MLNHGEKGKVKKKIKKNEKPKDVGHFFKIFDFWECLSKNVVKRASGKKASCHPVMLQMPFLSRLELIWPISRLKISKMSKYVFLVKSSMSQCVQQRRFLYCVNLIITCRVIVEKCPGLQPLLYSIRQIWCSTRTKKQLLRYSKFLIIHSVGICFRGRHRDLPANIHPSLSGCQFKMFCMHLN